MCSFSIRKARRAPAGTRMHSAHVALTVAERCVSRFLALPCFSADSTCASWVHHAGQGGFKLSDRKQQTSQSFGTRANAGMVECKRRGLPVRVLAKVRTESCCLPSLEGVKISPGPVGRRHHN